MIEFLLASTPPMLGVAAAAVAVAAIVAHRDHPLVLVSEGVLVDESGDPIGGAL